MYRGEIGPILTPTFCWMGRSKKFFWELKILYLATSIFTQLPTSIFCHTLVSKLTAAENDITHLIEH